MESIVFELIEEVISLHSFEVSCIKLKLKLKINDYVFRSSLQTSDGACLALKKSRKKNVWSFLQDLDVQPEWQLQVVILWDFAKLHFWPPWY